MTKPYYSTYVSHCMRFYARFPKTTRFNTDVDKENWLDCYKALNHYTEKEINILMKVYSGRDTFADNIYEVATKYNMNQDTIWEMIGKFEKTVARKRGLI